VTAAEASEAVRIAIDPMAVADEGSELNFAADTWVRSGKDCPPYWWMAWGDYWETQRPRILAALRSPDVVTLVARFADSPALYLGWVAYRPADSTVLYLYTKGAYRGARGVECALDAYRGSCASLLLGEVKRRLGANDNQITVGTLPPQREAIERARARWRYVPW
jgi:hypothetical protein